MKRLFLFLLPISFCLGCPAEDAANKAKTEVKEKPSAKWKTTAHQMKLGTETIAFEATVGSLPIQEGKGEVFFVSYRKTGEDKKRPISFCFNGGPGAASAYLHFGGLGPYRIDTDPKKIEAPYQWIENQESWLGFTDLVFVDPVGTGFSPFPKEDGKNLLSVKGDLEGLAQFITDFLSEQHRWLSPKYLIGESYGSFRVAGLSEKLQLDHGAYLNGVVMIGTLLDYQSILFQRQSIMSPIFYLPSYAATAWYYKKLATKNKITLEWAVKQARQFAFNDYALALLKGDAQNEIEQEKLYQKYSELTGLSVEFVRKNNMRIDIGSYIREITGEKQKFVSAYDTRVSGFCVDPNGLDVWPDPNDALIAGRLAALANSYLRISLGYEGTLQPYEMLSLKVNETWDFNLGSYQNADMTDSLRKAFAQNPKMKIYSANGYYDLATPFAGAEYGFEHLGLPKELRPQITTKVYEGGHMLYLDDKVRKSLYDDIKAYYQGN